MQPNLIISDVTLRDGNHAIRHQLDKQLIVSYCQLAEQARIPIVEVGHGNGLGASSTLVGLAKLSDTEMLSAARSNLKNTKLGIHVIPGFATIKSNLRPAVDLGVDIFRIASHCSEADITQKHIEFVRHSNKTAFGVLMMSHMISPSALAEEAHKMQSYGAEAVIIMDSSGFYLPNDVTERIDALKNKLDIAVGFHAHNNLGLAIGNSIAAVNAGASIVDGSVCGFGAGSGNSQLELICAVFNKLKYNTNIDFYKLLDLAKLVESQNLLLPPHVSGISIVSGLAGVFSGFTKQVNKVAEEYNVDPRDIMFELGKRKAVAGQENLIVEIALDLVAKTSKEEYHGF